MIQLSSPSEQTELISLWGSPEPGPTGNSSSRESTSLWPDMDGGECCGLTTLWKELSLPGREAQGGEGDGESTEGLKWARAWPVNLKGELRRKEETGEYGGVVLVDDDWGAAAGSGVECPWLLLLVIWETGKQSYCYEKWKQLHLVTF